MALTKDDLFQSFVFDQDFESVEEAGGGNEIE